jgi:hypothetical protein
MSTKETSEIASDDLDTPSLLQRYIAEGQVDPIIYRDECSTNNGFDKIPPLRRYQRKLDCVRNGSNLTFSVDTTSDLLMAANFRQKIPHGYIKEEYRDRYRMAWCRNLGHNLILSGELMQGVKKLSEPITSIGMDILMQNYMASGERKGYRLKIGMINKLTRWNTELPQYIINFPLPFSYANAHHKALKISPDNKLQIVHNFYLRNKVFELLRLQELQDDGTWKDCKAVDHKDKFHFDVDANLFFEAPEVIGYYAKISSNEKDFITNETLENKHIVFHNELMQVKTGGIGQDNSLSVKIEGVFDYRAILWVAIRRDFLTYNNYSNYSTDDDENISSDPIISSSFLRGTDMEWEDIPSDYHSYGRNFNTGATDPDEIGYHCHVFGLDLQRIGIDNTISGNKQSMLTLKLVNNNYNCYVYTDNIKVHQYTHEGIIPMDNRISKLSSFVRGSQRP